MTLSEEMYETLRDYDTVFDWEDYARESDISISDNVKDDIVNHYLNLIDSDTGKKIEGKEPLYQLEMDIDGYHQLQLEQEALIREGL